MGNNNNNNNNKYNNKDGLQVVGKNKEVDGCFLLVLFLSFDEIFVSC